MKTIAELTGTIDVASEELQSACARALSATEVTLQKMESKVDDQLKSRAKEYTDLGASMKGLELRKDEMTNSEDMKELVDFKKSATLVIEQLGDKTSLNDHAVDIFENLSVSRRFTTIGVQLEDFSLLAVKGLPVTGDGHYPAAIKRFFSHRELKDIHRTPSIDSQELSAISTVKIYVGDLPEKTTKDDLLEYFKQFGTVEDPFVAKDFKTGKSLNYGFVTFSDPQSVDKVLNAATHFLKGSRIYVRRFKEPSQREASTAPTSQELPTFSTVKIYVGDLPEKTTKDDLLEYFKQFGTVDDPYVAKDFKTGKSLNYGFVTFSDPQSVDKVLNAAPHFLQGSSISVRRFKEPSQREASTAPTPSQEITDLSNVRRVFVGGLSEQTEKSDLMVYFTPFGSVLRVDIILSRQTGRPRGFAFVTFEKAETAQLVLRTQPHFIGGRRVEIRPAAPRDDSDRPESPLLGLPAVTSCPQLLGESASLSEEIFADRSATPTPTEGGGFRIFVGNLDQNITKSVLTTYFAQFGEITGVELIYSRDTGQFRGFGFVTFAGKDSVDKILSTQPHFIGQHRANVCLAYSREEVAKHTATAKKASKLKGAKSKPEPSPKKPQKDTEGFAFFLGDLDLTVQKDAIASYFSTFGTVKKVIISPSKEIGTNRKHAFVFLESEESVKKVFECQPHFLCGSAVSVKPDTRKKKLVSPPVSPVSSKSSRSAGVGKSANVTKADSQKCPNWPQCHDPQCVHAHPTEKCTESPKGATRPLLHPEDEEKLEEIETLDQFVERMMAPEW
ncbi:hypothetical protein AAHC03_05785 [Spirometra sp. Aus1]